MRFLLVCCIGLFFLTASVANDKKPNIVLLFADDLGYADLGCFGAMGYSTPNLDRMANEGKRFTSFYTAQAVCSASRAALLTGCYSNRVSILGALNHTAKHGLNQQEKTIASVLKPRGYATAIFGKWHLGHLPQFNPTKYGFDEWFGLPYSNDMWHHRNTANNKLNYPELPLFDNDKVVRTDPDQTQLTTWYTERAVKFIEKNKDKPFFLYVPYAMPHVPLHVSSKFKGKTEQGMYGDVIAELDWSVGQILETLKRHSLDDNTLVVFTSDNGPWLQYGNHAGSAGPLRESKGTAWEGGVRVPCVMRWPGKIPARSVSDEPVMTIDLLPTFAKLAGAELPKHPIDGLDIWKVMSGDAKSPHDVLWFYYGKELRAIRSGKWKLYFPHSFPSMNEGKPGSDGKPGPAKQTKLELSLFDLEADIGEKKNVVADFPLVTSRLQSLADAARKELGDSLTKVEGTAVRKPGE